MAKDDESAELRIDWSAADGMAVQPVNIFMVQSGPDSHVLNLGFVLPPLHDERPATLPVQVVARVLLTPGTIGTLMEGLADNVRRREELQHKQGAGDDD